MTQQFALSSSELQLLLELLEGERKQLLVEIRHTDTADFRVGLKERLGTVESLLRRAQPLAHAELAGVARGV